QAAAAAAAGPSFAATRPPGFTPFSGPGVVVRVNRPNSMRPGGLFPTQEAATAMVDRAVMELTGQHDVASAWRQLVHPSDRVGIKTNGLGLRNIASNKETVIAIVNGVIAAGVPANQVLVYDQWNGFLMATRLNRHELPAGVRMVTHNNHDLAPETRVPSGRTQFAQVLLDCTAVIGVPLVKDHSLSGFTGAMKNMTHGSIKNPEDFHRHQCSPQIAELYNHDAIRTRVRAHVMDAFKVLYDGGPQDNASARVVYETIFMSTDPVALDRIGANIVDEFRTHHGMQTIAQRGDPPRYIDHAAALGLGVADTARITVRPVAMT
ncbi:MAG: DUF362 domain-containing protein, partial [Deltaproteobacteria bacterium]